MSRTMSRLAAIAVFLIAQAGLATAAEVKVFSTIGVHANIIEASWQALVDAIDYAVARESSSCIHL